MFGEQIGEALRERGIVAELAASNRVTRWAYGQAEAAGGLTWVRADEMVPVGAGWRTLICRDWREARPSQPVSARGEGRKCRHRCLMPVWFHLQPGDVLMVDLYGKKEGGTIVGDNLFHYIMRATKSAGLVVDGSIRDLEGIMEMDMPAYFRSVHPSAIGGATVAAINVPIRIGGVTVMPGDVVIGDPEGVTFVPPQLIEGIVDRADTTHIHDEWTKKKFDEGKYKSQDIYGSPHDPALIKEYQEYLAKRLEEIRKNNPK